MKKVLVGITVLASITGSMMTAMALMVTKVPVSTTVRVSISGLVCTTELVSTSRPVVIAGAVVPTLS